MPSKVSAIILNWNDVNATLSCAESVMRAFAAASSLLRSAELLIVDNGSTQDIGVLHDWCAAKGHPRRLLITNTHNLGFAGGMNTGIRHALVGNPDFIWLLNNDLQVDRASIYNLLRFSQLNSSTVITGATVLNPISNRVQTAGGYRYYPWLGVNLPILAGMRLSDLSLANPSKPDYVDGSAMWLKGDFIARLGQLPENHFLYFEELELTHCLQGIEQIAWCRDALVTHKGGGSSTTAELQERATYHAAVSAFSYTRRHYPRRLPIVILARLLGISLRAIVLGRPGLLLATIRALRDFHWQASNP